MTSRVMVEHARRWLQETAQPIGGSGWARENERAIEQEQAVRPSFPSALRTVARQELGSPGGTVRRAIAVLAILGATEDVPTLRALAAADPALATDVRIAIGEIEERAVAAQESLPGGSVRQTRDRAYRVVWSISGVAAMALGILGALFDDGAAARVTALTVGLGFGYAFLYIGRAGYPVKSRLGGPS